MLISLLLVLAAVKASCTERTRPFSVYRTESRPIVAKVTAPPFTIRMLLRTISAVPILPSTAMKSPARIAYLYGLTGSLRLVVPRQSLLRNCSGDDLEGSR